MAKVRIKRANVPIGDSDGTFVQRPQLPAGNTLIKSNFFGGAGAGAFFVDDSKNPKMSIIRSYPEKTELLKLTDSRNVDGVTGTILKPTSRFNVNADKQVIKDIVTYAKKNDVDPYTALAMALQETGLSSYQNNYGNTFHVRNDEDHPINIFGGSYAQTVDKGLQLLKMKLQYADRLGKKTEAERLQAWNGYGKIGKSTEGNQSSFYGIDVSQQPLDLNANPVYGKRIIDLRENVIKKNPEIIKMVQENM